MCGTWIDDVTKAFEQIKPVVFNACEVIGDLNKALTKALEDSVKTIDVGGIKWKV